MFGGEYAPEGWMSCEGQKLSIEKYKSLYSVIGFQYGFDIESNTFSLPDLRDTFITKEGSKKMHFIIATEGLYPDFSD